MLVDSGAIINLMSYSLYKKLGGTDVELMKTNVTISGVSGGEPISIEPRELHQCRSPLEARLLRQPSSSWRCKVAIT